MNKMLKFIAVLFVSFCMVSPSLASGPVSVAAGRPDYSSTPSGEPDINNYIDEGTSPYIERHHQYNTSKYILKPQSNYDKRIVNYSNSLTNWYFNNINNYPTASSASSTLKEAIKDAKRHPGYYKKCVAYKSHQGHSTIYDINRRATSDRDRYIYTKKFLDGILMGCYNNR
jgi:hypothetical protein